MFLEGKTARHKGSHVLNLAVWDRSSYAVDADKSRDSMSLQNPQPRWRRKHHAYKTVAGENRHLDFFRPVGPLPGPLYQRQKVFNSLLVQLIRYHFFVAGAGTDRIPVGLM